MDLIEMLRENGYDYIDGITRQHKPLQLWRDRMFNEVEYASDHISHVFKSDIVLDEKQDAALDISYQYKVNRKLNIGLTALDAILNSLGLGSLSLSTGIEWGKSMTISFNDSITKEYPILDVQNYLFEADLIHPNPQMMKDLNRDNLLVITGILYAKNFKAQLSGNSNISAELEAKIKNTVDGKLSFEKDSERTITLSSTTNTYFPIAVKASRIFFRHGEFKRIVPETDNRHGLF